MSYECFLLLVGVIDFIAPTARRAPQDSILEYPILRLDPNRMTQYEEGPISSVWWTSPLLCVNLPSVVDVSAVGRLKSGRIHRGAILGWVAFI